MFSSNFEMFELSFFIKKIQTKKNKEKLFKNFFFKNTPISLKKSLFYFYQLMVDPSYKLLNRGPWDGTTKDEQFRFLTGRDNSKTLRTDPRPKNLRNRSSSTRSYHRKSLSLLIFQLSANYHN